MGRSRSNDPDSVAAAVRRSLRRRTRALRRELFDLKRLLRKELRVGASKLTYAFVAFAAMTLLPGYPILLGAVFVCLGIFYSFQSGREANDILYTALLPIRKADVARAKYCFTCCVELAAFLVMALLTLLRMTALAGAAVYANNVMMAANPLFLGFALLVFAAFNVLFVGGFFKTAYNFGRPLVLFFLAAAALVVVGEALHHIPGLAFLNRGGGALMWAQYVILAVCAVMYAAGTAWSCRRAMARFEAIDL